MSPVTLDTLKADIEKVSRIVVVPTILNIICEVTGMGFAAVARVTEDRWIACSVRDQIQFGLEPGGELKIETTICNEIRHTGQAVIINNVAEDNEFCNHHTPRMYGFKSYISIPIYKKNGDFFGTLCAIDPNPNDLKNEKIIGMFNLFADLISFHLLSVDMMEFSNTAIETLSRQLSNSLEENRQYQFISDHNLQEPLRKMRFLTSALMNAIDLGVTERTKDLAVKINSNAQQFSMMIKDISQFSRLTSENMIFEEVDLNQILTDVCLQLKSQIEAGRAIIDRGVLPVINAAQIHMEQLFFHLISSALRRAHTDTPAVIKISSRYVDKAENELPNEYEVEYVEVSIQDNCKVIEHSQLAKIFDLFSSVNHEHTVDGTGVGLAYCRKLVNAHKGVINARSSPEEGTLFSIILPTGRQLQ
ncbi:GAF domain-containing sensor histidine kinase [Chryseosolibacter indicus]|uniref:histidine kinase n=1 Tax=Chryseosolibacter indicus TaxID=2782351 RepID=A0ABS5VR98_9BACT|nr:ATP-binding protein [Chryseosolibacter indicus]MBT1703379.1 GAF domain-containing protein [Chryseosolibacter indicus]